MSLVLLTPKSGPQRAEMKETRSPKKLVKFQCLCSRWENQGELIIFDTPKLLRKGQVRFCWGLKLPMVLIFTRTVYPEAQNSDNL